LSYFQIHSVFFLGLDNLIVFSYLDFVSEIIIDTGRHSVFCSSRSPLYSVLCLRGGGAEERDTRRARTRDSCDERNSKFEHFFRIEFEFFALARMVSVSVSTVLVHTYGVQHTAQTFRLQLQLT